MTEKLLLQAIANYEELNRILRKVDYEIYVGGLRSKLDVLKDDDFDFFLARTFPSSFQVPKKVKRLQSEIKYAEKPIKFSEDVQDKIIFIFKSFIVGGTDITSDIIAINGLVEENILQILNGSIEYKFVLIEERIKRGRRLLAQMRDCEKRFDDAKNKFALLDEEGQNSESTKKNLEELFDEVTDIIYDADLAVKDAYWLRIITYLALIVTVFGGVIGVIAYFKN
jgi:hypothetical protein